MKKTIALALLLTLPVSTVTRDAALAFTVGSGMTSSGNIAAQLGQIAESAGPLKSFQADLFTGRAQTAVPISIPPGRKNIQPNLSLAYSSSGGNGWLGTGWGLDAGFIQRSVKKGVPSYGAQDYIFSFQGVSSELVSIAANEYRAKDEALFLKFVYDPSGNSWTVTDKSGTKHYFGLTSGARQTNSRGTFKWALSKVKDTSGNYMSVSYAADRGELYLSRIEYNGNETQGFAHTHKVEFTLEDRSDVTLSYRTGTRVEGSKRLKEILVQVKNQQGAYRTARKYVLAYEYSPKSKHSRLKTVTEYGKDGAGSLPPVMFSYQDELMEFNPVTRYAGLRNDSNVGNNGSFLRYSSVGGSGWADCYAETVDLNGDGKPDRIQKMSDNSKWKFYKNNGDGAFADGAELTNISSPDGSPMKYYPRTTADAGITEAELADLNGDGLVDRVTSVNNGPWYYQKNTGGVFDHAVSIGSIISADGSVGGYHINYTTVYTDMITSADLMDMNGDGLPDRILKSSDADRFKVQYNSLNANGMPVFGPSQDFTGVSVPSGAGPYFRYVRYYSTNGSAYRLCDVDLIDMNGDGLPDRVMTNPGDATKWKVQFNRGDSFDPTEDWGPIDYRDTGNGANYEKIRSIADSGRVHADLVDINGDGLPDRVVYHSSTTWHVQLNTGKGFVPEAQSVDITTVANDTGNPANDYIRMTDSSGNLGLDVMDIDGDGLQDRIIAVSAAAAWKVQMNKGPYPDLLKEIDNGRGGKTLITYKSSSTIDNKDTNGKERLPFAVQVVSQVKQRDGLGNEYTLTYDYKGGMYDPDDREFRGFREVTVTDATGTQTVHFFHQDDAKKGKLWKKEVSGHTVNAATGILDPGSEYKLFSKEETTWSSSNPYTGVTFTYVSLQDNYVYDGDDTSKHTRQAFTYDSYGNLVSAVEYGDVDLPDDERRNENTYVYNTTGYVLNTLSKTTRYDDDTGGNIKAERYFYYDGAASITAAPAKGLLTKEEEWLNTASGCGTPGVCANNPKTEMTYDNYGNVATVKDARGYTTANTYETTWRLFLTQINNALSQTRQFSYDERLAQIVTSGDENGQVTTTEYDSLGRITKVYGPLDSSAKPTQEFLYEYPSLVTCGTACVTKTTAKAKTSIGDDPLTQIVTYSFSDGLGREIQRRSPAEDPNQQIVTGILEFDSRGQVGKQWAPFLDDTSTSYRTGAQMGISSEPYAEFSYDAPGRRTRIDYPDDTWSKVTFSDFVKTAKDPRGKELRYTSDAYGRPVKVEEFNSGSTYTTTYEYDVLNNLKKTTDNASNETTVAYDSLSRKTAMSDPDMGSWSYAYDLNGNLASQTDAKSQTISFQYDQLNRVTLKDLPGSETDVNYTYDSAPPSFLGRTGYWVGRLARVVDASGTHEFKYDKQGRVVSDKKTVDSIGYQFDRTYDAMGRVRTLTYPDTEVVTYTYNGMGDVETISGLKSGRTIDYIKDVDYNAAGQITFTKYGNNVTSDYTFNADTLRLSNILTKKPDGTTKLQDLAYRFDGNGNVASIADTVNSMSQSFEYDDLNRLTKATGSAYGGANNPQNFQYDSIGNMISKGMGPSGASITMTYGAGAAGPHAVTEVTSADRPSYCPPGSGSCAMGYDANGNMTTRGVDTLAYDSENRLREMRTFEGTQGVHNFTLQEGWNAISFSYLPDNRSITSVLSRLTFGADYDQISYWDPAESSWKHFVNDSDFNDFGTFEFGRSYDIYVTKAGGVSFSVSGKTPAVAMTHPIKSGDNFVSPVVTAATAVSTVLAGLALDTDYSDVKRYNAATDQWESWGGGAFTNFEPMKGYIIAGLRNASFTHGAGTETTATFVYDSTGSRVKKTAGGVTTVYFGKDYEKQGALTTKHIFLGDRRIATKESDGDIFYIHGDHINSSNVLTDSGGNRSGLLEYDPYGSTATQTGSADPKHKFTGQEQDDSTKLYYYGARYYDPQLGRFITADSYVQSPADPQALNRYAYARNNPVLLTDPSGSLWFLPALVGAVIGALAAGAGSGWNAKAMIIGAGIGLVSGAAGGGIGSAVGALKGAAIGGAAGGSIAGGLDAAVYGGDVGQAIARGAGFGALGGIAFGGMDAGIEHLINSMKTAGFRWELAAARIAMDGAAGGALSHLSGGEFWEGVAFSSAISGSRFLYRAALELSGQPPADPSLRTSDGTAKAKPKDTITWGLGSPASDVGNLVSEGTKPGFIKKWFTGETAPMMRALSRVVPGLDPMAEMHDPAMSALKSRTGMAFEALNKATLAPAYGITVLGALREPAQMAAFVAYGEDA